MIREKQPGPVIIDLTGPDGNAYVLLAYAKRFGKQLGMSSLKISDIINDMTSSDYEHLLLVFDKHFGDYVILER